MYAELKKAGTIIMSMPILAVMFIFDGAVSALRAYRPAELVRMSSGDNEALVWEWGTLRYAYIFRGIYVMGYKIKVQG